MIHCKLKHFRYNDEKRALRYAAHLDEWSMRCHLDLYIYTNRYPNVNQLSWAINYSPRRVVAEVSPLLPAASVSSFVSGIVPVAEHLDNE